MSQTCTGQEVLLMAEILHRIGADISMITDRELAIESNEVQRASERPAGAGGVHISFRFGIHDGEGVSHGCLLMPLPEAIALAGYLMMQPDAEVAEKRELEAPDEPLKEAILEVGNFIAGATDAALRESIGGGHKVRPEGCQGVRADVRPALVYEEGTPLVVGHAKATLEGHEEYDMILVLPEFDRA